MKQFALVWERLSKKMRNSLAIDISDTCKFHNACKVWLSKTPIMHTIRKSSKLDCLVDTFVIFVKLLIAKIVIFSERSKLKAYIYRFCQKFLQIIV